MTTNTSTRRKGIGNLLEEWLPKLVLSPTLVIILVFIYGFMIWTFLLSLTNSRLFPVYNFVGLEQYIKLFANDRWMVSLSNLAIFGILFVLICLFLGLFMAVLLDQKIRGEGFIRTIYLYPMALSFVVTGTAWKWMLNPTQGLEKLVQSWGFENFHFDWLVNPDYVIYTVVIAAVWQSSGFIMALFLAGLRGVDNSIIKAAQIDGASMPTIYTKIIIPSLRPVFFSAIIMLAHIAIKTFDLVMALTGGGPGYSSDLPGVFMYQFSFTRGQLGIGAASSIVMLMGVLSILVPYLYSELRASRNE